MNFAESLVLIDNNGTAFKPGLEGVLAHELVHAIWELNDFEDQIYGHVTTGTGNALDNSITGNSLNNTLTGNAGNDTLTGAGDTDALNGGIGNDTYILGRGYGSDTITDNDATGGNTDVASFLSGIATDQLWFRHVNNNLEVSVTGTSDKFTIQNWYSGSANHIEQFRTADGHVLLGTQVENLVQAMASFAPPSAGADDFAAQLSIGTGAGDCGELAVDPTASEQ